MAETKHFLTDRNKILLKKDHHNIFFMSRYSEDANIVTRYIEGNENSFFLPKELPLEDWHKGRLFARSWDNHAPWIFEKHGILGANHGSFFTFKINMLRHWLFEEDIGKCLTDDAGNSFILLSIENLSTFYIHSDLPAKGEYFCDQVVGSLHLEDKTLVPEKVTRWMMNGVPGGQISPHQRYNKIQLLANGNTVVEDGETLACDFAELSVDMDLVFPDELLCYLKANPGKYIAPNAPFLKAVIKCEMTTIFQKDACRRIRNKVTFLENIPEAFHYGMIQYYSEEPFSLHEKLAPGFKPFTEKDCYTDLNTLWSFPEKSGYVRRLTKKDAIDPKRLPNTFIDLFGNNNKRELGVVLGYSPLSGVTARGKEETRSDQLLYVYQSGKIYPYALQKDSAKTGESYLLDAFHQYFPPSQNGVCIFYHEEEDGKTLLYGIFPEKLEKYTYTLPEHLAEKEFIVFEKDEEVSMERKENILFFHSGAPSSIILKEK